MRPPDPMRVRFAEQALARVADMIEAGLVTSEEGAALLVQDIATRMSFMNYETADAIVGLALRYDIPDVEHDRCSPSMTVGIEPSVVGPAWFIALVRHIDERLCKGPFERWLLARMIDAILRYHCPDVWEALYRLAGIPAFEKELRKTTFLKLRAKARDQHERALIREGMRRERDRAIAVRQVAEKFSNPPRPPRPRALSSKG